MADVEISGPLFDGRADSAVKRLCEDAEEAVAQQGFADVHKILNQRIRHATPYYETQIAVEAGDGGHIVHDRGVIYGPWLNGTGSRNETTRFKGYGAFRLTKQQLHEKVPQLVEPIVKRHLPEMGGD
jgi:hypothetical protein